MGVGVVMIAFLALSSTLWTESSGIPRAFNRRVPSPVRPFQRPRFNFGPAYGSYATGSGYGPGTGYGVGGIRGHPALLGVGYPAGGYGYASGLNYNAYGLPGVGPSNNVFQSANVFPPPGSNPRFDFTQRTIGGFANLDDPTRRFGVNFNTLRVGR
ncbi:uncharacterized protein LOC144173407 [Haemaphysalis longicornis]